MTRSTRIATSLDRTANAAMFAFFLFAAMLQYNDPDPIRWMTIYGFAAAASLMALLGKLWWPPAALLGIAALVWAGTLSVRVIGRQSLIDSEEGREMIGLLLVFVWMSYLVLRGRRLAA